MALHNSIRAECGRKSDHISFGLVSIQGGMILQERYQRSLPGLDTGMVMPSGQICTALMFGRCVRPKTINLRLAFTSLNQKPLSGNASNYARLYPRRSDQNRVIFRLLSFFRITAEQPTPLWHFLKSNALKFFSLLQGLSFRRLCEGKTEKRKEQEGTQRTLSRSCHLCVATSCLSPAQHRCAGIALKPSTSSHPNHHF